MMFREAVTQNPTIKHKIPLYLIVTRVGVTTQKSDLTTSLKMVQALEAVERNMCCKFVPERPVQYVV